MFYDVPRGKYRIEADLPPGLVLAQTILRDAPPPLEIAAAACVERAVTALLNARITGHVVSDSGIPADLIYREELNGKTTFTWRELQQGHEPYSSDHVAAGRYILVFNERDERSPDAPFGRTFFGDVSDVAQASRLVVSETDGVITADIHVHGPKLVRSR